MFGCPNLADREELELELELERDLPLGLIRPLCKWVWQNNKNPARRRKLQMTRRATKPQISFAFGGISIEFSPYWLAVRMAAATNVKPDYRVWGQGQNKYENIVQVTGNRSPGPEASFLETERATGITITTITPNGP